MSGHISDALLAKFSPFLAEHVGLYFPSNRLADMQKGIEAAAEEFGLEDASACVEWLMAAPLTQRQVEILAGHLTVGETYFFRDKRILDLLEKQIFPALIHSRRGKEQRLRIWSAGCCTGEEPYSIAMLLNRILPDLPDWKITIMGSDINPRFLKKASAGMFGKWSFRGFPDDLKERYFEEAKNGSFEIAAEIKRLVAFTYLNLVEDVYPSLANHTNAMDVIFCRNVLMYFSPEQAKKAAGNLYRSLVEGGWLVTSQSETSQAIFGDFDPVDFSGVILYQKKKQPELAEISVPETVDPPHPVIRAIDHAPSILPAEMFQIRAGADCLNEGDAGALSAKARVCANAGKLTEALALCHKAISADKMNPSIHYLCGVILQEQGAVEEAAAELRRALYLDSNFTLAHFALGNLSLGQLKYREASRCFNNALRLLRCCHPGDVVPDSEGVTAGHLSAIIESLIDRNT